VSPLDQEARWLGLVVDELRRLSRARHSAVEATAPGVARALRELESEAEAARLSLAERASVDDTDVRR
jgi:hypothetical protein